MAPPRRPEIVIGLRRREVVALGVRRDARRRGAREQARSQQGKRPRLAFRRVPRFSSSSTRSATSARSRSPARGRRECRRRTCRAWPPTRPPGCSAATPRPTSATRWSSRRPRSASRTRCCRSPSRPRDRRGEGSRGAKGLPDPREHQEQKQAAQHPAGVVPRVRIAGRPVRRLRTAAHGRPRRAVVGGRRRAPKGGGPRPRRARRGKVDALVGSVGSSARPDAAAIAAEDRAVRFLARRIAENAAELQAATAEISALLERDETYRCLLTVPG